MHPYIAQYTCVHVHTHVPPCKPITCTRRHIGTHELTLAQINHKNNFHTNTRRHIGTHELTPTDKSQNNFHTNTRRHIGTHELTPTDKSQKQFSHEYTQTHRNT